MTCESQMLPASCDGGHGMSSGAEACSRMSEGLGSEP